VNDARATKHGVIGLRKSAALDYAEHGIRINVICPGIVDTEMMDRFTEGTDAGRERVIRQEPIGQPDEIASAVLDAAARLRKAAASRGVSGSGEVALLGMASEIRDYERADRQHLEAALPDVLEREADEPTPDACPSKADETSVCSSVTSSGCAW
jgi:hypothetical protein